MQANEDQINRMLDTTHAEVIQVRMNLWVVHLISHVLTVH